MSSFSFEMRVETCEGCLQIFIILYIIIVCVFWFFVTTQMVDPNSHLYILMSFPVNMTLDKLL